MGSFAPLRVLIVEDEPLLALELEQIIHDMGGIALGVASKATEAIVMVGKFDPDLVLMDVRLQGVADGIGAAYMIQACQDVPILFVTAHDDDDTTKRIANFNGSQPIRKPIDRDFLCQQILSAASSRPRTFSP